MMIMPWLVFHLCAVFLNPVRWVIFESCKMSGLILRKFIQGTWFNCHHRLNIFGTVVWPTSATSARHYNFFSSYTLHFCRFLFLSVTFGPFTILWKITVLVSFPLQRTSGSCSLQSFCSLVMNFSCLLTLSREPVLRKFLKYLFEWSSYTFSANNYITVGRKISRILIMIEWNWFIILKWCFWKVNPHMMLGLHSMRILILDIRGWFTYRWYSGVRFTR